jgi:hypothetical protein
MNKGKDKKLPLDEINHYMKVAKAIHLTAELQEKVDRIYNKERFWFFMTSQWRPRWG